MISAVGYERKDSPEKSPRTDVFQRIKSICVPLSQQALALTKDTSAENKFKIVNSLEDLVHSLRTVSPEVFSAQLGDYVFFPLSHLLRLHDKLDDRTTELLLMCLGLLIANSWGKNLNKDLAKQLCILIVFLIDDGRSSEPARATKFVSDEAKTAGCRALHVLFRSVAESKQLAELFKDGENIPMLAHTVSVLLSILLSSDDLTCELEALDSLRVLLLSVLVDGDMICTFLPGVISTLCKVITLSIKKTHYKVLSKSVALFALLLAITFSDFDLKGILGENPRLPLSIQNYDSTAHKYASHDTSNSGAESDLGFHQRSVRTKAWLDATKHQVKMSLDSVTRLRGHSRPEVRMEVKNFCARLLRSSFNCLDNCRTLLLITLIFLSGDENYDISFESFDFVRKLGRENLEVVNLVKDGVYQWIASLQRTLNVQAEDVRLGLLLEIRIGIDLLLDWEVDLAFFQEAFISNFLVSVRLTAPENVKIAVSNSGMSSDIARLEKDGSDFVRLENGLIEFPQSHEEKQAEFLNKILENMGASFTCREIVDECIQIAVDMDSDIDEKQVAFWMYIHMVKGARRSIELLDDPDTASFVTQAAGQLDAMAVAGLNDCLDLDDLSSSQITMMKLCLEGLALAAEIMGEDFRLVLMDDIYPVLNLVAAAHWPVRQHAYICLNNISIYSGYSSISALLVDNVDYVLDHISLKLNTIDISPRTPKILSVLIRLAGYSAIPYLDDLVESIFQLLDNFHGYSRLVEGFFEVLKAIVEETSVAYMVSALSIEEKPRRGRPGIWDLESLLVDLTREPEFVLHEKENVETDGADGAQGFREHLASHGKDEDKNDAEDTAPESEEVWRSAVPKSWYLIIKRIASLTKYYLSHSSVTIRIQLLDLLATGIPVLATSQKDLLPIINDTWPSVVLRLSDPETHVVVSALGLIGAYSACAGDFMASRIEQLWPKLKAFVPREIPRQVEGKFSRSAQLLKAALECMTSIVRHTRLNESTFHDMVEAAAPFLRYNDDLRAAMEDVSSDAVWLCLNGY